MNERVEDLPCMGAEKCPCANESTCGACDHPSAADCAICEETESWGSDSEVRG